jgi:hypothetical protein
MCIAANIFGVDDETDEAIRMELIILLCNLVLKKNLVDVGLPWY